MSAAYVMLRERRWFVAAMKVMRVCGAKVAPMAFTILMEIVSKTILLAVVIWIARSVFIVTIIIYALPLLFREAAATKIVIVRVTDAGSIGITKANIVQVLPLIVFIIPAKQSSSAQVAQ